MDLTFLYRTFVVILCLDVTISRSLNDKDNTQNGNGQLQALIDQVAPGKTSLTQMSKSELSAAVGIALKEIGDKDRKLVRYELDLGVRDAGEAAKKILEKRYVNYTDYAKKQPPIDPNDGRTVTPYLNFQRNKLDHVPGAIETGLVGNSFEEQYSLIVETLEKIFRGYFWHVGSESKGRS